MSIQCDAYFIAQNCGLYTNIAHLISKQEVRKETMFEYEKCIQEVKEAGIEFTEAEKTYIRCARINGINLIDSLYEKYIEQFVNNDSDNADDEYLTILTTVLTIRDYFDKNMVELIKQLVRMKAVRK